MTDLRVSLGYVVVVASTAPDIKVSQSFVNAVVERPAADTMRASHAYITAVVSEGSSTALAVSQSYVIAVVSRFREDPVTRVWTYTLDGHDYYVMNMSGTSTTLVYDTHSEFWSIFANGDGDYWRASTGSSWVDAGSNRAVFGSNVVCGDYAEGVLYFLDPEAYSDESYADGSPAEPFQRELYGQITHSDRGSYTCDAVTLQGAIGQTDDVDSVSVTLSSSFDGGITYTDHDTLTVNNSDYDYRVQWRSLGSFKLPGAIFKIVDDGALQRIDSMQFFGRVKNGN